MASGSGASRRARAAALAGLALVVISCTTGLVPEPVETPQPLSSIPGPSVRQVGAIARQESRGQTTTYHLADGREVTVDAATTRVLMQPGGSPRILVVGRDANGTWAAEIGHQEGMPADCYIVRDQGFELGDSIAIDGVRWPKAAAFDGGGVRAPAFAFPYPDGTRFCLDDQAQVAHLIGP